MAAMQDDGGDALRAVERFLYREAALIDAARFDEWLELFTPDALYWVPSRPGQTDPRNVASIIYEDREVLGLRVRRLSHPGALMLSPPPRTTHLVSNVDLVDCDDAKGEYRVASAFLRVEYRNGRQRNFSGHASHHLRRTESGLRIAFKRVDLADCDGVHGAMMIPF